MFCTSGFMSAPVVDPEVRAGGEEGVWGLCTQWAYMGQTPAEGLEAKYPIAMVLIHSV